MTTDDPGAPPLPSRRALKELRLRALETTDEAERRALFEELAHGRARRRLDQAARMLARSGRPDPHDLAARLTAYAGTPPPAGPHPTEDAPVPVRPTQPRRVPPVDPGDTRSAAQILAETFDAPPGFIPQLAALDEVTRDVQLTQIRQKRPDLAALIHRAIAEHQVAAELDDLDDA